MDKNAIKSFAIESRRQMIESVKYQASLIGITADGINEPISKAEGMETYDFGAGTYTIYDEDIEKRKSLVKEIKNKGQSNTNMKNSYNIDNLINDMESYIQNKLKTPKDQLIKYFVVLNLCELFYFYALF